MSISLHRRLLVPQQGAFVLGDFYTPISFSFLSLPKGPNTARLRREAKVLKSITLRIGGGRSSLNIDREAPVNIRGSGLKDCLVIGKLYVFSRVQIRYSNVRTR